MQLRASLKYAVSWTVGLAILVLPMTIVAKYLIDVRVSTGLAFLCGAMASGGALIGAGYLTIFAQEKWGFEAVPRKDAEVGPIEVLFAIALCFAGGLTVASIATSIF